MKTQQTFEELKQIMQEIDPQGTDLQLWGALAEQSMQKHNNMVKHYQLGWHEGFCKGLQEILLEAQVREFLLHKETAEKAAKLVMRIAN